MKINRSGIPFQGYEVFLALDMRPIYLFISYCPDTSRRPNLAGGAAELSYKTPLAQASPLPRGLPFGHTIFSSAISEIEWPCQLTNGEERPSSSAHLLDRLAQSAVCDFRIARALNGRRR